MLVLASLDEVFVALLWGFKPNPKGLPQSIVSKMIWVAPRKKFLGKWTADETDHDMFLFSMFEECVSEDTDLSIALIIENADER